MKNNSYHKSITGLSDFLKKSGAGSTVQPSYIREAQPLPNTGGVLKYTFKETQQVQDETDVRLAQNDIFRATHVGLFLAKAPSATIGLTVSELFSYPNATEFPVESGTGEQITSLKMLEAVYNGKVEMKIGDKTNIESLPSQLFRIVPQTQKSSSSNKDQFNLIESMFELPKPLNLTGRQSIEIAVSIPTKSGLYTQYGITESGKVYAVLVFFGGRVKDGMNFLESGNKEEKWKGLLSA